MLSIAGVLAYPALQPALLAVRGEAAARRTAAFLDDVRRRAVMGRKPLTVSCLTEENRLVVREDGRAGEEPAVTFAVPEHADLVSCKPEEVRYLPQGYASGFTLTLRDRRGQAYEVTVGAFTGLARLERAP